MTLPAFWQLENFTDCLDAWKERERPAAGTVRAVIEWIFTRDEDPYVGVTRDLNIAANLWWGPIATTVLDGTVVVCSYWIIEESRSVRCVSIATLSLPL